MTPFLDVVSATLILIASGLALLTAVGLQRFDTVFARIHPATKSITVGVVAVCVAAALQAETASGVAKLLLIAVLQLLTAPIASHMVARAAYRAGTETSPRMQVDELAPVEPALRDHAIRMQGYRPNGPLDHDGDPDLGDRTEDDPSSGSGGDGSGGPTGDRDGGAPA